MMVGFFYWYDSCFNSFLGSFAVDSAIAFCFSQVTLVQRLLPIEKVFPFAQQGKTTSGTDLTHFLYRQVVWWAFFLYIHSLCVQ